MSSSAINRTRSAKQVLWNELDMPVDKTRAAFVRGERAMQNYKKPKYRMCPRCRGWHFHTTQWKSAVERCVLNLWGLRPYQCRECYKRFYLRPVPQDESRAEAVKRTLADGIPKETARIA